MPPEPPIFQSFTKSLQLASIVYCACSTDARLVCQVKFKRENVEAQLLRKSQNFQTPLLEALVNDETELIIKVLVLIFNAKSFLISLI